MKWILFLVTLGGAAILGGLVLVNTGTFNTRIAQTLSESSGARVSFDRVRVPFRWPLTIDLQNIKAENEMVQAAVRSVRVEILALLQPYNFKIAVQEPKVKVKPSATQLNSSPGPGARSSPGPAGSPTAMALSLKLTGGEIDGGSFRISRLNVDFAQARWMKTPAQVKISAFLQTPFLPGALPVTIVGDNLLVTNESIKASGLKSTIAGLNASVQGTALLNEGRHRWLIEAQVPSLAQVPAPPDLPLSDWSGEVRLKAEVTKENQTKPWAADGQLLLNQVKVKTKWKSDRVSLNGPLLAQADVHFSYVDGRVRVPKLEGMLDLTAVEVEIYELLKKVTSTTFKIETAGSGSQEQFELKKLKVELWKLQAEASGQIRGVAPYESSLNFQIKPTSLKGLENLILPLKTSPVDGDLSVMASYKGPAQDPWSSDIKIAELKLNHFKGQVALEGTQGPLKAHGPVAADIVASGEMIKGQPKNFVASGKLDLSGLAMATGPLRKEARQAFRAQFMVRGDANGVRFQPLDLAGFFGNVKITGEVQDPKNLRLNTHVEMKPLDLSELRMALPEWRDKLPKGNIKGHLQLVGPWSPEVVTFEQKPIVVTGDVAIHLPEYRVEATPSSGGPKTSAPAQGALPTPESSTQAGFAPKGPLTEKLNLKLAVSVGQLTKENLVIKGFETKGQIYKGAFSGEVLLREIFGGKINLSGLKVPLFEAHPQIQGQAQYDQLIIQDLLKFIKPEFKEFALGRAKGSASFTTALPSEPQFLTVMKVQGQTELFPVTFNTVIVGQMINDQLSKVKMLGIPPVKVSPLKGQAKLNYSLSEGNLALNPFWGRDEDESEVELKGKVTLTNLMADLSGQFLWAKPQVKGCVLEGNADEKGRLKVPLSVKGSVFQPEMSILGDTFNKLAGRALNCEKTKIVEQIKKDGGKKLEQEAKKVLKGILGN